MRAMGGPLSEDAAHARFDTFAPGSAAPPLFVGAAVVDGRYVGHGFLVRREEPPEVELGFLVRPEDQRCGHGTAIARALVRRGLDVLDLGRIIATVDVDNPASIRVLEKAGFEDLGTRHDDAGPYRLFATSTGASRRPG